MEKKVSIVAEIQSKSIDSNVDIKSLLILAKLVATKLGQIDTLEWIKKEIEGYSNDDALSDSFPDYRLVPYRPQFRNIIHGWCPVIKESSDKYPETGGISKISDLCSQDGILIQFMTGSYRQHICDALGFETEVRLRFEKADYKNIIDSVRHKILDWSLELEARGITGEGVFFPRDQIERASSMTLNINNNGHMNGLSFGDNSPVSSATMIVQRQEIDAEKVVTLLEELVPQLSNAKLSPEDYVKARKLCDELESESRSDVPNSTKMRGMLISLKDIMTQSISSLITQGAVQMISSSFGL